MAALIFAITTQAQAQERPVLKIQRVQVNKISFAGDPSFLYKIHYQNQVNGIWMTLPYIASDSPELYYALDDVDAREPQRIYELEKISILSNLSAVAGPFITNFIGQVTWQEVRFTFTITAGNHPLYLPAEPARALTLTSTGLPKPAVLLREGLDVIPELVSGDRNIPDGYFAINPHKTRTFIYGGKFNNQGGTYGVKTMRITAIHFGVSPSDLRSRTITEGLEGLSSETTF